MTELAPRPHPQTSAMVTAVVAEHPALSALDRIRVSLAFEQLALAARLLDEAEETGHAGETDRGAETLSWRTRHALTLQQTALSTLAAALGPENAGRALARRRWDAS